jgi:hypothetical protein
MNLMNVTAILCAVAGFLMILFGYFLTKQESGLRDTVHDAVKNSSKTVNEANAKISEAKDPAGVAAAAQQQAAISGTADYVKALAELAKSLAGLTPAVASFIIATILFFFAASLGAISFVAK